MNFKAYIAAATVALSPVAVSAASVDINFQAFGSVADNGDPVDKAGAVSALDAFIGSAPIIVQETFNGFTACPAANCASSPVNTSVGTFTSSGGTQTGGGSQVTPEDQIVVRSSDTNVFGRFSVIGSEDKWLDSNDVAAIQWGIPGASSLSNIVRMAFFLTDVDDVGQLDFQITASGDVAKVNILGGAPTSGRPDGELLLVTMLFDQAVNNLGINMKSGTGDGFGIDGITVAAVPLPAGGLLLLTALGGMAVVRRRRKAA